MSICYLLDGETPPARKNGKSLPCVLLQAENAELRKERDALDHLTDVLDATNDGLQAENAELRELAILNWEWAHSCCGNNCKMQTNDCGYQIDRDCNYEREIWDRMRERGIEVDG